MKTICIVGGNGVMGHWFSSFFKRHNYNILIYDKQTQQSLDLCIANSDIILISVPIDITEKIIKESCNSLRPGQLIVDNTSIKSFAVKAMTIHAPRGAEVLGMHTIFGPSTESVTGKNVIFVKTKSSATLAQEFINIFCNNGANVTFCTPDYHDRAVAFHQNLVHLISFVLSSTLTNQYDINNIMSFATPNSVLLLAIMCRFLHGDASLYTEIQQYNTQKDTIIENFRCTFNNIAIDINNNAYSSLNKLINDQIIALGDDFIKKYDNILTIVQNMLPQLLCQTKLHSESLSVSQHTRIRSAAKDNTPTAKRVLNGNPTTKFNEHFKKFTSTTKRDERTKKMALSLRNIQSENAYLRQQIATLQQICAKRKII